MNRYIAAFALLLSASDVELGLVKPKPVPAVDTGNSSETPNSSLERRADGPGGPGNQASQDLGAVVGAAIESAVPKSRPVVIYTQTGCAPCRALEKQLADGVPGAEISYSYDLPAWCESTPAIYLRDVRRVAYGYHSRQQFIDLLERNKPVLIPQAVSVGTIKVRSQVDAFLSLVKPGRNGPEIVVGSARILMPSKAEVTEEISPETYKRVYTGTKPVYVYGILSVPVSEMTMSRNKLRLIAGGWPVELTVE